ncbi:unnamed protein product [Lactuca virosa]|uniref:Uncharacterized protein n=1 Tax=Lactuca virosa TaxID=75947 RepID=A0AAU9N1Y9_9ASTR|nr:unnamed protein product [Lactuca virosa]
MNNFVPQHQHFILFSITFISSSLATGTPYPLLRHWSISLGCILSLIVGANKGIADELRFFKSVGASAKDTISDIVGVIVADLVLCVCNVLCFYLDRSVKLGQTRGI